jgi:hypothetical protein
MSTPFNHEKGTFKMKAIVYSCFMRILVSLVLMVVVTGSMVPLREACAAGQDEARAPEDMTGLKETALRPGFTFHIVEITEGIKNYPLERQLTNILFADFDFTIIIAVGFTADNLDIKLTDKEGYGDRLMGIALAFYKYYSQPFWGSVYSGSSGASFTMSIPVSQPGVIVWLYSGYQRPSLGENPYAYTIELTLPQ